MAVATSPTNRPIDREVITIPLVRESKRKWAPSRVPTSTPQPGPLAVEVLALGRRDLVGIPPGVVAVATLEGVGAQAAVDRVIAIAIAGVEQVVAAIAGQVVAAAAGEED